MKKIIFILVMVSLMATGCSSKEEIINETADPIVEEILIEEILVEEILVEESQISD